MYPRFRPMTWLLSTTAAFGLSLGVAHAQALDDEDPILGDDSGDADSGDGVNDATAPDTRGPGGAGEAGYDKGFYIKSGDGLFSLRAQAYVQGLLHFESDNDPVVDERTNTLNFRLNRGRLTFSGHAFRDNIKYKFQADFARGRVALKDFYVDYGVTDDIMVRVGQYKRPFSRQHLTSSSRLELVSRSITDDAFLSARDLGVMVHNNYEKSPELEWAVGVFNARTADDAGLVNNYPDRMGPAVVVRAGINRGNDAQGKPLQGYAEADLEGGPMRFGVAGSLLFDLDSLDDDGDSLLPGVDGRNILAQVDFIVKNAGISATGGFYLHHQENIDGLFQFGFHLQGGYMVTEKHQAAARFAMVSSDIGAADRTNSFEASVGHSFYMLQKHNVKWQNEIRLRGLGGEDFGDEIIGYSQVQLSF